MKGNNIGQTLILVPWMVLAALLMLVAWPLAWFANAIHFILYNEEFLPKKYY